MTLFFFFTWKTINRLEEESKQVSEASFIIETQGSSSLIFLRSLLQPGRGSRFVSFLLLPPSFATSLLT